MSTRGKVIIIGSGLGGLSCGYILQKNGYDVIILEQHIVPGGCLQCFRRGGVNFETGMHFIGSAAPGQTIDRLFHYMEISDDILLSPLDTNAYDTVSIQGSKFEFPNGREPFIEKFSSYFPKEKDALVRYFDTVTSIAQASSLNNLSSDTRDMAIATEYQLRSMNSVMDEMFHDELLKSVLVGNLPLYAAEKDKTPFSQQAFIMDFYNKSAFRVAGGSDAIAKSLVKSIENLGGEVRTRARVSSIACDDTHATGVFLESGEYIAADYVIGTIHPARLMEMLDDTKLLRPAFKQRLKTLPQTTGCFVVYMKFKPQQMPYMNTNLYGYCGSTPWDCEHYTDENWPKGFLYMHMCPSMNATWAESGVVIGYMAMGDVLKWKDTKVGHRGSDYEDFKRHHAERLLDMVEKHAPGLRSKIDDYWTSTPLTYLDYTGTEGGSLYGVAKDFNLGPAGRVPYRTKIPNLLLAGQNVNSHGVLGVMVGTIVTCSELVDKKIFNF